MIDIKHKYEGIIFVNASDIKPSPDNITSLIQIFKDMELIPSTFHEIGPSSPQPLLRIRLSNSINEWEIMIGSQRISIKKNLTDPKGNNLGELDKFCSDITDFSGRILNNYRKKANRLALTTEFILKEMTEPDLLKVYLNLFKPPQFYKDTPPFEWNTRFASKKQIEFENLKETLNVLTSISRVRGEIGTKEEVIPIDRIQIGFDINTIQENSDERFEFLHLVSYYECVLKLHNELLKEVMEFVYE